jgi:tRNA-2-methylthio-N6-dimethylallyladenosine synthase
LLENTVEVLFEKNTRGKWQGRTRTDKLVFFSGTGDYTGKLVNIKINKTSPWSLQGKIQTTTNIYEEEN